MAVVFAVTHPDDCGLLAHTEEDPQHIVNRFSDAAKNFCLTISVKKTEVLCQTPPLEAYSLPHISIDSTNLNAMEHLAYFGSIISKDAKVSKDLDNFLSKASSSFGRLSKRVRQSHSLSLSTKIQVYRAVVIPTLLYGTETWFLCRKLYGTETWVLCRKLYGTETYVLCRKLYGAETGILYRKQIRLLEQFHQHCLRSILGIKWQDYVSNKEVLKKASLPSIESILLQVQLRCCLLYTSDAADE